MTRWKLVPLVVLAIAACGKKGEEQQQAPAQPAATDTSAAMGASDTTGAMAPADTGAQATTPSRAAAQPTTPSRAAPAPARQTAMPAMPAMDEPWTPTDTGTVNPGMTRDEVVAVWGAPVTERTDGAWTYLYYRNGCEVSCGTFDVVFLENGEVVNAIVRGRGHTYGGTSTSPPGVTPRPTPPMGGAGGG
jgi:hypothetical protein